MIITLAVVAMLVIAYIVGYFVVTMKNYQYNWNIEKTKIKTVGRVINDQNGPTGRAFRYGVHSAGFNACETIAVHNVKVLLGMESHLPDIMRQFQMSLGMVGYGIGGSNVYLVRKILRKNGISSKPVRFKALNRKGIYVISYFNDGKILHGIHTVTVEFDGESYTVYNLRCNGKIERGLKNLEFARKYVCGFYIESQKDCMQFKNMV